MTKVYGRKKILITGATGFVGRYLIPMLGRGKNVVSLVVRDKSKAIKLFGMRPNYIEFNEKDLRYKDKIKEFNPDIVIHLASYLTSQYDTDSLIKLMDSNIRFGSLILDALSGTDVKYFINTGSFSEYYKGIKTLESAYLYSATKNAFKCMVNFYRKTMNFKVVEVAPYSIYGPGDNGRKVIHYIIDSLVSSEPIPMTNGEQILDFIYITDVANFYLKLVCNIECLKNDYTEYHVRTGIGTSIRQIAALIEDITNKKANIKWGALPYRKGDIIDGVATISVINFNDIKWKPRISLREGLTKMLYEEKGS